MKLRNNMPFVIEVPQEEADKFDKIVRDYRYKYIRSSNEILDAILSENNLLVDVANKKSASGSIQKLREIVWQEYLKDEVEFNALLMRDLHNLLETPKNIIDILIAEKVLDEDKDNLAETLKSICGEYAGRVFPYIYKLSLSNTNSRRSRAGKTFESIIYKTYEILNYPYDSQSKVGRKIFDEAGLGKKVDSILPNIECFKQRRNKTIIGTMKTSLRERWQEVAEEIERTNIPEIHLLTCDDAIASNKADEMANHNITVVTYDWVANSKELKGKKNIISFEEYLFTEIPNILNYWNE